MGIRSVVTASIPDRRSLAVRTADDWVLLEGYSAAESYLDVDAVIAAAKGKGCEAIHPGYGFLSERADFSERCAAEGLVFIGPPPEVLRALGDKSAARRLAVENGVPVVPGWDGDDDDATLIAKAEELGFPVMLKARGGGGGRGMRPVHDPADLPEAIESARREAEAAFGEPGLLLEKLMTDAHHVEVQVVADSHGNVIHMGERDCSVQRRRQKLIEETPSPIVDEALRAELTGAALKLARAVGYVNAGTFEFLVTSPPGPLSTGVERGSERAFYFLEVNPRLQVEHPVTEMVTGLDLVELQLRVAAGEELPVRQEDVRFEGHAIEFRINAEDPWNDFRPSSGEITDWVVSMYAKRRDDPLRSCREDTGYETGDVVPAQYDSLLAKRIVHGDSRSDAVEQGGAAIDAPIRGVSTNVALHAEILRAAAFRDGKATIEWLQASLEDLLREAALSDEWWVAAGIGATRLYNSFFPLSRSSALTRSAGWLGAGNASIWLGHGDHRRLVVVPDRRDSHAGRALVDGRAVPYEVSAKGVDGLRVGERREPFEADIGYGDFDGLSVTAGERSEAFKFLHPPPLPRRAHAAAEGATAVTAPLAGTIASVRVGPGDQVEAGDLLLTLDAMKMEHRITATAAGTVAALLAGIGAVVREGDVLVELA